MYEGYPMGIPNYNVTVMTQVYNGKSIEYIASSQWQLSI